LTLIEFPKMPDALRLLQSSKTLFQILAAPCSLLLYLLEQLSWRNNSIAHRIRAYGNNTLFRHQGLQRLIGIGPWQTSPLTYLIASCLRMLKQIDIDLGLRASKAQMLHLLNRRTFQLLIPLGSSSSHYYYRRKTECLSRENDDQLCNYLAGSGS